MNEEIKNNLSIDLENFTKIRSKRFGIRYQRYMWVVQKEKEYDLRNANLHGVTTELYHNATQSFIAECDLAAILAIHATIELFVKNVVDPKYKIQDFIRIKMIFDEAESAGWISAKLRQEYIDYDE